MTYVALSRINAFQLICSKDGRTKQFINCCFAFAVVLFTLIPNLITITACSSKQDLLPAVAIN